ncbi:MAG TPA: hypothetical protein VGL77_11830 [Armatimonadota bacterium]|jgi:hypothetical protein
MEPILCLHCHTLIETPYRQTLLGFRKYTCPACGKVSLYPLPDLYRGIYWTVVVFVGVLVIFFLLQGRIGVPGLLSIVGVISLIRDRSLRRQVDSAQQAFLQSRQHQEDAPKAE